MRTKQRDTFLKSKMLSTVRNKRLLSRKRPPRICFFLKMLPYSIKETYWVSSLIPISAPILFQF